MTNKNVQQLISRFLDTNGDGTGTKNARGNYASAATPLYFKATTTVNLHRMIIHIGDTTGMQAQKYGNIAELTNGYTVKVIDNDNVTELMDLCNLVPIKSNGGIGRYCYDVELRTWGAGNEFVQARWTFAKAGQPLRLKQGQRLSITLNDDLTGLLEHYFMVQGYIE